MTMTSDVFPGNPRLTGWIRLHLHLYLQGQALPSRYLDFVLVLSFDF